MHFKQKAPERLARFGAFCLKPRQIEQSDFEKLLCPGRFRGLPCGRGCPDPCIEICTHEIFFEVSPNIFARRILTPIKNRLWDFPRKNFVPDWYLAAVAEHGLIVDAIETRSREKLMHAIKELHWDFHYNERHIRKVYSLE